MSFRAFDDWCVSEANRRAAMQPQGNFTFEQLPQTGVVDPSDLICLERNGINYGAPASAIPTSAINPPYYYNIETYNAVGDGTTINDTFLNDTVSAAGVTGGTIFVPFGNFKVSNSFTWVIPPNVSILGTGPGASIFTRAGGAIGTSFVSTTSGASFVSISNVGFTGNGVNPTPSPNAPTVIVFNGGTANNVRNCYFTGNTGDCIDYLGVTGGEVTSCRFNGTGYNAAGSSTALQNPAVLFDATTVGAKCHHNDFIGVKYFAIQLLGTNCEASYNYLKNTGNSGIRIGNGASPDGQGAGSRVIGNEIDTIKQNPVDGNGGTGIYANHTWNLIVMGNVAYNTDDDGMAFAGCSQSVVNNNIAYNCCQVGGDCGFQFNPQAGVTTNNGMTFIGNVSYDNQGSPTQKDGMRVLGAGATCDYATIVGNNFNGFTGTVSALPQYGIEMTDGILQDDTNVIRSNAGSWFDYQHLGTPVSVPATTTAQVIDTYNIFKGEMGLSRGFHVVAYGITTVTTSITWYLTFGASLGNAVTFNTTSAHSAVQWRLEADIYNSGATNGQKVSYAFYYNGALAIQGGGTLSVDTTADVPLVLQVTTSTTDTVTVQAFTLDRR